MPDRPLGYPAPKRPRPLADRERQLRVGVIGGTVATVVLAIALVGYAVYDKHVLQPQRTVATVAGHTVTAHAFLARFQLRRLDLQNELNSAQQMLSLFAGNPDFEGYLQQQVDQLSAQLANPANLGQQVMDEVVEDVLIAQELEEQGGPVTESEVDQEIERAFGLTPAVTPTPAGTGIAVTGTPTVAATLTPTALTTGTPPPSATPAPSPTPYTREAFQSDYRENLTALARFGVREEDYRARFRSQLARNRLRELLGANVPRDAEQVWARHILLGDENRALEVLDLYLAGRPWEELAAQFSLDTGNRDQGGDLGWFPHETMVAHFEDAAFAGDVGEVVGPLRTEFGWHLIEIMGHEVRSLDESVYGQRVEAALQSWILGARASSDIQVDGIWVDLIGSSS
ncbi:MAG: peptidylprolyl isomerase [Anaerolineales bacterium]